ncbi:bifunctional glycosyltransferase family 2/GtrA family protein [Planococcus halotolerans]|uniref:Family 2 glycosyl transferase n=1 Tax=Planococcus halotolerans TaxID=2233542 RepID=A0A365KR61_9BACL|nr:bifunctional glycosyltransferase family 2/GtrA family protein [Planococcus halotolerans]QHJ69351.1 glycosyltransferase [Planococcus halotolerans]RAZ75667.1 family 2 glycosyl transferase [Planococcus halotolerans]
MNQFAIIIPAYKPDQKCLNTVEKIINEGFERIIVVDDGSGKEHAHIFISLEEHKEVTVLRHADNQGKGRALKTAFQYILTNKFPFDAVITADADGQHLASDMVKLSKKMQETPDKVVLGARDFSKKDIPFRSRFGNRFTRLLFRLSTGTVLTDTQTGLRGIPVKYLPQLLEVNGERFEYEMNVLAALRKNEIEVTEVTIETVYIDDNKSSHFNPLRDSFHIYKIFIFYGLSGGASFALDIGLYWIFIQLLRDPAPELFIIIATIAARILSSLFNYYINRNKVFKQGSRKSLVRYFALAAFIMLTSAGSVHLLYAEWLGRGEVILKVLVDTILFIFGFVAQRAWVFRKE